MPSRLVLALLLCFLFFLSLSSLTFSKDATDDLDEDLSFLEEENAVFHDPDGDAGDDFADDEFAGFEDFEDGDEFSLPVVDEQDVVILKANNFSEVIDAHKHVMVEFYAPWCGHCQALAPEYAGAASQLKSDGVDVVLAKIDATEETELSNNYDVQGFPTVLFFVDGDHKPYTGERTK